MKEMYGRREREAKKKNGEDFENPFQTGELPSTVATVAAGAFKGKFGALVGSIKCFAPRTRRSSLQCSGLGYAVGGARARARRGSATSILADVMTNVHSVIIIATNHVGDDDRTASSRDQAPLRMVLHLRAVIGSANFRTGGDLDDFFHGWLNYQIEHAHVARHLHEAVPDSRARSNALREGGRPARAGARGVQPPWTHARATSRSATPSSPGSAAPRWRAA